MCLECIINACVWRLGTVRGVGSGTGSNTSGMLLAGNADPFHTRIHVQPQTWSQGIPGTPNRPGNRSTEGITPGSLALSPPAAFPRLPFSSPWPEPSYLPLLAECRFLRSLVRILPCPSAMVLHLAVTEMGRIFIDTAERGESGSDREDQKRKEASLGLPPFSSTQVTVHLAGRPQPPR